MQQKVIKNKVGLLKLAETLGSVSQACNVVGKVVTGYLADIFGRRVMWVVSGVLTALYLPILIYAATPGNVANLLLLFGFLYGAPYAINSTYLSESFAAGVRGTAVATSYNLGRIGSMLSPLLIGVAASSYSIGLGIGLLGISMLSARWFRAYSFRRRCSIPKQSSRETFHRMVSTRSSA